MNELYFKPIGGVLESRSSYPRMGFEPIIGNTEMGEWFIVVEQNQRPADSLLYNITYQDEEGGIHPTYPALRVLARTWSRVRKTQEEIDMLLDAREQSKEESLLRRAVATLVRADDVELTVLLALVNASTLGAAAKDAARNALAARHAAVTGLKDALEALQAETVALKTQAAQGIDVEVQP